MTERKQAERGRKERMKLRREKGRSKRKMKRQVEGGQVTQHFYQNLLFTQKQHKSQLKDCFKT